MKPDFNESTAHLIDSEPVMILGCSNHEIMILGAAGFSAALVVGLVIFGLLGYLFIAFPFAVLVAFCCIYFGGKKLGRVKEGRPDGYYGRVINMHLTNIGAKNTYIRHCGLWRIRR